MNELNGNTVGPGQALVTVAVPVFNGENFLAEALDSVLAQTYENVELIILDNASTDRTEDICRRYAQHGQRVRYLRSEVNRGVYWNFKRALEPTCGKYFMWLAHDDKIAPEFLERCVKLLEEDDGAVLAYPKAIDIDENGIYLSYKEQDLSAGAGPTHLRFRELIRMDHNCEAIFGLMRTETLRKIRIFGNFADADRVMLAELSLHGHYRQVADYLFLHREHPLRTTNVYPKSRFERTAILLSRSSATIVFPYWRQLGELFGSIHRTPLSWRDRIRCYGELLRWICVNWKRMLRDIKEVAIHIAYRVCGNALCRLRPARNNHPCS